ncbi:MAG: hypothetical protein ABJA78_07925 [Ferruginibacter sp.]
MNKKNILFTLLATAFFLSSCQKDIDRFVPDPGQNSGPDTQWYSTINDSMQVNVLRRNLLMENHPDSFEINSNTAVVNSSTGVTCTFPPNSCVTETGVAVTGKVYAEIMLVKKKGDMIRMDKPTVSTDRMLISGGEVFIRITQGGHELRLAPNVKVEVKFSDTPLDPNMKLFYGDETNPDRFSWIQFDTSFHVGFLTQSSSYQFSSNKLHWINCDYFYNFNTSQQVRVADSLPVNYTNANTVSYLVFNTLRSVIRLYGDVNTKRFISTTLPIGLQATLVVVSKQGNDYYLGHEGLVTGAQLNISSEQVVKLSPVKKSLADVEAYLSTL